MCTTQLSNFKFNTRKRGFIHNEHSTDEGHSPETSGHMFKFFGTLNNVLNFNSLRLFPSIALRIPTAHNCTRD